MNTNDSDSGSALNVSQPTLIFLDFILVCASAVGAIANILIIFVICRTRSLRTAMNANLVSLAIADLIVCFILIPIRLILYNHVKFGIRNFSALCQIDVFVKTSCDSAQLFMLVATSFERFQSIARPFEKQGHTKRTAGTLTMACLLSLGLGVFNSQYCGAGATVYPCYTQNINIFYSEWGDKEKNITLPLGLSCLFLVLVFYGKIMKLLNEHNTTMQNRFKNFKNKVSPTQKLNEKSTSNAILQIHSTVPINIGKVDNDIQNGNPRIHKGAIVEDSGYNEPVIKSFGSKDVGEVSVKIAEKDICQNGRMYHQIKMSPTSNETEKAEVGKDKIENNQAEYKNLGVSGKEENKATTSWKQIISARLFRKKHNTENDRLIEPITVLRVHETKRFPLVRERVTLAKLERCNDTDIQRLSKEGPKLQRIIRRVKSASEIHQNNNFNQKYTFVPGSFSCSALRERLLASDKIDNAIRSQVDAAFGVSKNSDIQVVKSFCDKLTRQLPNNIKDVNPSQSKVEIVNTDAVSTDGINKTNGFVSLEKRLGTTKGCDADVNSFQPHKSVFIPEIHTDKNTEAHSEPIKSINTEAVPYLTTKTEALDKDSDKKDLLSVKITPKQESVKRVEVVEMDGTVHKKVKVESGAVVGAVCVMNNNNRVQGRRKVEMRTAKNIAILIGTFVLLWLPLPVVVICLSSIYHIQHVPVEPVLIIASASTLTVALNPILNVLLNKQMRSRTISTLKNCKKVIR